MYSYCESICPCFISCVSYPLPFLCDELACSANVKELICHAAFKECADIDGSFLPALSWYVRTIQVHIWVEYSVFFLQLIHNFWGIYFAAEASVKWERRIGMPALRKLMKIQRISRKTLIYRCLVWQTQSVSVLKLGVSYRFLLDVLDLIHVMSSHCSILHHISLETIALVIFGNVLPTGPSGERNPFRFLECDVQGGNMDLIQGADAALALFQGQTPFAAVFGSTAGVGPSQVISLSWPQHMEIQDLYPATSSTYTLPTGFNVAVSCVAHDILVGIRQTECRGSFVNPVDPNHDRACVKVSVLRMELHVYITRFACVSLSFAMNHSTCSLAQWQHTQTKNIRGCGLQAVLSSWLACCWTRSWSWLGKSCWFVSLTCWYASSFEILAIFTSACRCFFRCLGGKKLFIAVPFQVKACVFAALLYAIVHTLPSLVLKYDLPCSECKTEEW